jgi:membrane protease YdiL (CAAX protease family)
MALTAIPSFVAVWLHLRKGSLLLPVLLHIPGNPFALLACRRPSR